jgi:hypothetical protein
MAKAGKLPASLILRLADWFPRFFVAFVIFRQKSGNREVETMTEANEGNEAG